LQECRPNNFYPWDVNQNHPGLPSGFSGLSRRAIAAVIRSDSSGKGISEGKGISISVFSSGTRVSSDVITVAADTRFSGSLTQKSLPLPV